MTQLNLIQAQVSTPALARWARERGWVRRKQGGMVAFDEGQALHHMLNEMFGPGALRPFRLLVPPRQAKGSLYGYSTLNAETLRDAARTYAGPEHLCVMPPDHLKGKPIPGHWRTGQRLGFDLRTRPVRRLENTVEFPPGERMTKGAEIDAFILEALRRYPGDRQGMKNAKRTREAVYLDWLTERTSAAANLDPSTCRLVRFQRTRVAREKSHGPEGPDATIHGTLTVTDTTAFAALLARGVGRHRAYGYGMLLLRPPNRPALDQ